MELARKLRAQARERDERRLLVLSGLPADTRARTQEVLDTVDIPPGRTTYVGPTETAESKPFHCECLTYDRTQQLLGTTRELVVLDCHSRCEPNILGQLVGTVDGGGLFVLLTPPLSEWRHRRDAFDGTLAVPPFELSDVGGRFRSRLVRTLRQHRGIALVDADTGDIENDGLHSTTTLSKAGRDSPRSDSPDPSDSSMVSATEGRIPASSEFPDSAYEQCLTGDQVMGVSTFEALLEPGRGVVLEAARGRGKSTVAGLSAACLAVSGQDVLVTGPQYRAVRTLMGWAGRYLDGLDVAVETDRESNPHRIGTPDGTIRYRPPSEARNLPADPDCVIVDEAAAIPVGVLADTLEAPRVAYVTTTHGYEGTGRGFTVRFRDRLTGSRHEVFEHRMTEPIRYASGDPVEVWSFRALGLDARPPVEDVVADATPASVTYRTLTSEDLLSSESLLGEIFGLLVLAHYRTEPNDLARVLDAPNVSVHALFADGHPVSVALLAREGGLRETTRRSMYEGERIRGNLIPDVLTSQLRDEVAGEAVGYRVMRITTHSSVRCRGLGSTLLSRISRSVGDSDWLGVSYGATPDLVSFWEENGFSPVHLSTTRNDRSGEHSAIMLRPLSKQGEKLLEGHTDWLVDRLPGTLADSLDDVDPDVVRAVCSSIPAVPQPDLTDWEWRHAASVARGPGIFEMSPEPIRRLGFTGLVDTDCSLSPRESRLLVMRVLQLRNRDAVVDELGFDSARTCMREVGSVVDRLLDRYGPRSVDAERERFG